VELTSAPRHAEHSLHDVARRIAPHLRIISASRPTPLLRDHNIIAVAVDEEAGRRAVLAVEGIETSDEKLGTVVMGAPSASPGVTSAADSAESGSTPVPAPAPDPEGVSRHVLPRVLGGGVVGAIVGAIVVGGGAYLLGADGWQLAGAAIGGAMMVSVFGAMWLTFSGLGGSSAYRETFVNSEVSRLTIVSVHTDDADEAVAARDRLEGSVDPLSIFEVDRFGRVIGREQ
jgi:hypothetical protein